LRWHKSDLSVETKADQSPVTRADKESEAAIIEIIRRRFPDHALLTEESGALGDASPLRWIVDPLDGTRGFIRGGSFWGPLVALEQDGRVVAGAMALPALGDVYWAARGLGAHRNGERLRVSATPVRREATISLGEMKHLFSAPHGRGVLELIRSAPVTRGYGDLAACAMLLRGQCDAWLEAGVQIWDVAPLMILVEEAGGRFTDLSGRPTIAGGQALATNGKLHAELLEVLGRSQGAA
jgi:histidinol-phosphatase